MKPLFAGGGGVKERKRERLDCEMLKEKLSLLSASHDCEPGTLLTFDRLHLMHSSRLAALSARLAASIATTTSTGSSLKASPLRLLVTRRRNISMASSSSLHPSTSTEVAVVYCTAPSAVIARSLARHLVEDRRPQRLAACVNIIPQVTSIYSWKGKIEEDSEVLMIIKTRKELLPALAEEIKAGHPYEVPEVLALPAIGGSEGYLRWVIEETKTKMEGEGK